MRAEAAALEPSLSHHHHHHHSKHKKDKHKHKDKKDKHKHKKVMFSSIRDLLVPRRSRNYRSKWQTSSGCRATVVHMCISSSELDSVWARLSRQSQRTRSTIKRRKLTVAAAAPTHQLVTARAVRHPEKESIGQLPIVHQMTGARLETD